MRPYLAFCLISWFVAAAGCHKPEKNGFDLDQVAGNEEVARYLNSFEGRGTLSDNSIPTPPQEALAAFELPQDLKMDLVLSEPQVHQPLELTFDHRGRLWVVQYNQYPYPEGLKVTGIDHHLRATFDRTPDAPPSGVTGADKITFFEDTDGDGVFDKSTDAVTGLNIATGVAFGRGRIWVLNPPYLLAYPDVAGDGLPDGPPKVHLGGFGLEDTHAVANSLCWGPDGWLYGATGSTVTSNISSAATRNVQFEGQAIWRYHPETQIFEIFAEGGGNTFHVEIDAKGRIYSGDNGAQTRGQYYKQGAYYQKNWGKHGPLTNPYAFGYLKNMKLEGDARRFTHAWIKYEGAELPMAYHGKLIAINPLLNYLQLSDLVPNGSTFRTIDGLRLVETQDHWFRPVDIKAGPDGAVYLADWYDSRLSHVDPNDNWHKSSGRVYRIRGKHYQPVTPFDLSIYSTEQLVQLLYNPNKWYRQQAIRLFGDRKDSLAVKKLKDLLKNETGQLPLEALWAINVSGYFNPEVAQIGLLHSDPYVRLWTVRLLGDMGFVYPELVESFNRMAANENHPEVISQLACSARRLPASQAIPLIRTLINLPGLVDDPDNPMLIWWAVESNLDGNIDKIVDMLEDPRIWGLPVLQTTILERLSQRLIAHGTEVSYRQCTRALSLSPHEKFLRPFLEGIHEGLRGRSLTVLPDYLNDAIRPYWEYYGEAPLAFDIQQKNNEAIGSALLVIKDRQADIGERLAYIRLMGSLQIEALKPVLLKLVEDQSDRVSVRQAALAALTNFQDQEIGERIATWYPDKLRADPALRLASLNLFSTRSGWARHLISLIEQNKQVNPDDVPPQVILQLQLLDNDQINAAVARIWPASSVVTSREKQTTMKRISRSVSSGAVEITAGKQLYGEICGNCHKLFDEGGALGPDLTGYDRGNLNYLIVNIVDPNVDIREGFVNYKITTSDDRTLAGTISNRSSELVVLRSFIGEEFTIPIDQIKQIEAQPISLMPERLVDHLSDQQLRNLFGYIMRDETN